MTRECPHCGGIGFRNVKHSQWRICEYCTAGRQVFCYGCLQWKASDEVVNEYCETCRNQTGETKMPLPANMSEDFLKRNPALAGDAKPQKQKSKGPNKTEAEYRRLFLDPREDVTKIRFEGGQFPLWNGHIYTPDFVVWRKNGQIECHEVKGAHIHSRDSGIFVDSARVEYPNIMWIWAQKRKDGWRVNGR